MEGSLDGVFSAKEEVPKVSVWFICQLLELWVRCCSVFAGGDEVALGCV